MSLLNNKKNRKGFIFWLTGLSGSGKTTIAELFANYLEEKEKRVIVLDGDYIRKNIHTNLGFSKEDIEKNNCLTAELAQKKAKEFDFVIVPIISPYSEHRKMVREIIGKNFFLVFINSSLETCIKRDTKGLYKKAQQGEIKNMIGYNDCNPYEIPGFPDLILKTDIATPNECIKSLTFFVKGKTNC